MLSFLCCSEMRTWRLDYLGLTNLAALERAARAQAGLSLPSCMSVLVLCPTHSQLFARNIRNAQEKSSWPTVRKKNPCTWALGEDYYYFFLKEGREKMGPPNVPVSLAPTSLLQPGCLCSPQLQVGSLVAASDLLQAQKGQEHACRLITPMSRYLSRQNLCVQVLWSQEGLPWPPFPFSCCPISSTWRRKALSAFKFQLI